MVPIGEGHAQAFTMSCTDRDLLAFDTLLSATEQAPESRKISPSRCFISLLSRSCSNHRLEYNTLTNPAGSLQGFWVLPVAHKGKIDYLCCYTEVGFSYSKTFNI